MGKPLESLLSKKQAQLTVARMKQPPRIYQPGHARVFHLYVSSRTGVRFTTRMIAIVLNQQHGATAFRYCGIHNPKMVAQCEVTGKWFCNGHVTKGGTCVIQHLVRGRYKEVRLHPQSPLGNTILECYHSGSRNIFSLGFVPVKGDDTIVLLARDTPATASCVKELDLNMNLWESIIQVRRECLDVPDLVGRYMAIFLWFVFSVALQQAWLPQARRRDRLIVAW